jgi:hypothetical protein
MERRVATHSLQKRGFYTARPYIEHIYSGGFLSQMDIK